MAQRVTIRKRTPYNTKSNRRRVVKTPGGKLVYHHLKKLATSPKCGDCGVALPGVSRLLVSSFGLLRLLDLLRSPRSVLANTRRSLNAKRLYDGHMVEAGVVIASSNGAFNNISSLLRMLISYAQHPAGVFD
jgi:hypothetical protein